MELVKKFRLEWKKNGFIGVWKKARRAINGFLYYATTSDWYELKLEDSPPAPEFNVDVHTDFMVLCKHEVTEWIKKYNQDFPWLYCKKELDCACLHSYCVIRQEKQIIGYIKIGIDSTYIRDFDTYAVFEPSTAFVYDTFILPDYRGRKLTVFALDQVARYFREQGFERILCHIEEWNLPSVKSFKRAGFQRVGTITFIRIAFFSWYILNKKKPFLDLEKVLKTCTRL